MELLQFLQESPISQWNLKEASDKFYQGKLKNLDSSKITRIDQDQQNELSYDEKSELNQLTSLFGKLSPEEESGEMFDWSTLNPGTFFVKIPLNVPETKGNFDNFLKAMHNVTTMPGEIVSLPDIVQMYNIKNIGAIGFDDVNDGLRKRSPITPAKYIEKANECDDYFDIFCDGTPTIERTSTFKACFEDVINTTYPKKEINAFSTDFYSKKPTAPSPCLNLDRFPTCLEYCNWHENYFYKMTSMERTQFIAMMGLASPQRKVFNKGSPEESSIAGKNLH